MFYRAFFNLASVFITFVFVVWLIFYVKAL